MRFNKQWLVVGFIALVLCWANAAMSAILHVPSDYETIQAAIDATANGDIVLVADGIYTDTNLTWDGNTKHITVKAENGPDNCIIDCEGIKSGASAGRAFYFNDTNQTATDVIEGFTITNGSAEYGGGIYCYNSSPTITGCIFIDNSAIDGGGIYCNNSSPAITDCEFTSNEADWGGGIALISSSPTITNCTIGSENEEDGNYAEYEGGGIYIGVVRASVGTKTTLPASSSPIITGCWIVGNEANDNAGGGISCDYSSPTITGCDIEYNYAEGWEEWEQGYGGGIFCHDSTPTITNCTIEDNSIDEWDGGYGGGICLDNSPSTITNCEILDNYSEYGGGIYIIDDGRESIGVKTIPEDPSSHTIINCEIAENSADAGGGIYVDGADLVITNCTIASNNTDIFITSAKKEMIIGGNGIFAYDSSLTIRNSILWGNNEELPPNRLANGDPSGAQIDLYYYSDLDIDYSDVEDGKQGVYVDDELNNVVWGDNNISEDPSFIIAPFYQYHLHLGSPCIDAGTSIDAPLDDIDGQTRPFGEGFDMGSDEYVWECPVETGEGAVEVSLSGNAAFIGSEEINESDLPDTGKPDLTFPYGLLFLEIIDIEEGATVTVTLTFPDNVPTDAQYWKYNEITEEWYRFDFGSNDGDNVITLTLTDGGAGDMDGIANSIILDPGGIGMTGEEDKDDNKCFMESILGIVKSNTEEIMLARHFRDTHLLSNPVGQIFVSAYYKTSPMLVGMIREYPVLRSTAREMLRPIIWMSNKLIE